MTPGAPGQSVVDQNKGITSSNVEQQSDSLYCFKGLPFQPRNVQVTVDTGLTRPGYGQAMISHGPDSLDFCTGGDIQAEVFLLNPPNPDTSSGGEGLGFYVTFFG